MSSIGTGIGLSALLLGLTFMLGRAIDFTKDTRPLIIGAIGVILMLLCDILSTGVTVNQLLLSLLAVASKIAAPAPRASAGGGMLIPPTKEPRTAKITTRDGHTILISTVGKTSTHADFSA